MRDWRIYRKFGTLSAVAVATLWLLAVGGEADLASAESTFPEERFDIGQKAKRKSRGRLVRVFRRGWHLILAAIINQPEVVVGDFFPEAWPQSESKELPINGSTDVPVELLNAELNLGQGAGL